MNLFVQNEIPLNIPLYERTIKVLNIVLIPSMIFLALTFHDILNTYETNIEDGKISDSRRFLQEDKVNNTNFTNNYYDFDEESLRFLNFISEIKDKTYAGKWSSLNNVLELNNSGLVKLRIVDENINKISKLTINKYNYRLILILQEGNALDKFMSSLVTLSYKNNFNFDSTLNLIKSKDIKAMSGYYCYFKNQWVKTIDIAFIIELTKDKFNQTQKKIQGKIFLNNYELDFEAEQETPEYIASIHNKVNNFSIILTIIGSIHLLHSTFILKKLNIEPNYSKKLSLFAFSIDVLWNSVICVVCMYLSYYYENFFRNDLLMPGIVYCINVTLFELRIVFNILQRNFLVNFEDPLIIRKIIFRFYIIYYILLYITVVFSYEIFFCKPLLFFTILITWIPQIIRYAQYCQGTVNILTLFILSINKVFIPLYIWKCPNNFMLIKSNDTFSQILIITILIQMFIILLQMIFGPRWIIPWFLRKKEYNYFRTIEEVKKEDPNAENNTCPICLNLLISKTNQEDDLQYNTNSCKRCCVRLINGIYNTYRNCTDGEKSKPFMITPCKHVFHSYCLSLWLETNLVCPICREATPPVQ